MNVNVNVAVVSTQLAPGQVLGEWVIEIVDASGNVLQSQTVTAPSAQFTVTDAGTYTAQAKRIDSTGALFGAQMVSDPFVIPAAPSFGDSAGAITVTVS